MAKADHDVCDPKAGDRFVHSLHHPNGAVDDP